VKNKTIQNSLLNSTVLFYLNSI